MIFLNYDNIYNIFCYVNTYICQVSKKPRFGVNERLHQTKITFLGQRNDCIAPDIIIKSFWVSTSLALILTIPPLAIFMAIFQNGDSLLIGVVIGFGLHFLLFSLSGKISSIMTSFLDD
jgi:hypothetical protein